MRDDPLFYVRGAGLPGVPGILMLGIAGFAKGGEFNRKHGNRIMRWRIGAQLVAVILILLFVWIRRQG
jgi:hypothetical protein